MLRRGNKILKCISVESRLDGRKKDPSLMLSFKNYSQKHKKTKAIIKIARKLVNRIRYVLIMRKISIISSISTKLNKGQNLPDEKLILVGYRYLVPAALLRKDDRYRRDCEPTL